MRIVGQHRLARGGAVARDHPVVGGPYGLLQRRHQRQQRPERQAAVDRRHRAQDHRTILGIAGVEDRHLIGLHMLEDPGAHELAAVIAGELPGHQLAPDQRVHRPPRLGPDAQQVVLRRQRPPPVRDECVDARGVGLKRRLHLLGKLAELPLGRACQPERAHHLVGIERAGTEPLGEPPGAIAALRVHLEEAILGMDVAEREGGIEVVLGGDGGDADHVARDPHRGRDALHDARRPERRQRGMQPQQPRERRDDRRQQEDDENAPAHAGDAPHGPARDQPRLRMMVFFCVKCSSMASSEASLPSPDCFTPP
jgi:hypothetical protein